MGVGWGCCSCFFLHYIMIQVMFLRKCKIFDILFLFQDKSYEIWWKVDCQTCIFYRTTFAEGIAIHESCCTPCVEILCPCVQSFLFLLQYPKPRMFVILFGNWCITKRQPKSFEFIQLCCFGRKNDHVSFILYNEKDMIFKFLFLYT